MPLSKEMFSAAVLKHYDFDYGRDSLDSAQNGPVIAKCICGAKVGVFTQEAPHEIEFETITKAHADHVGAALWKLFEDNSKGEIAVLYSDGSVETGELTKHLPHHFVHRFVTDWEKLSEAEFITSFPDEAATAPEEATPKQHRLREAAVWDEAYIAGRQDAAKTGPYAPTKRPNPYEPPTALNTSIHEKGENNDQPV